MTDLHEAFRSLADDEPGESRIDPDVAVRASRARSRTRRHRWLAGAVAAALVVGVGAVVVGPRLAPGSTPAITDASRDVGTSDEVSAVVERAAQTLRDLGYDPRGGRWVVSADKIRWSFTFPDPDAPADDPTSDGTGEPPRLTVVLRPDSAAAGSLFCNGPSCGGLVRTQVKAVGTGYGQVTQDNGVAQQVLERAYGDGGLLQLVATGGMQGGRSGGVVAGHPLTVEQLTTVADAIDDPTSLFPRDLPLPDPSASPADVTWGDGRIDCGPAEDVMAAMVHLPADAGEINAAYLCEVVTRKVEGDGTWQFQVVRRIDGDLAALQTVLAPADAPRSNGSCTMNIDLGMPIWVVTEAGSHVARVPVDGCGHAVADAVAAVAALPTTVVSREKLRQEQSQVALESGCSQDFKDMLRVEAADGRVPDADAQRPWLDPGHSWTLCTYDAVSEGGDAVGSLTAGRKLRGAEVTMVNAALAQSRLDPTCVSDDHTRFATLIDGTNYWIDVALDGCAVQDHPINGGSNVWRAPDSLRVLLA